MDLIWEKALVILETLFLCQTLNAILSKENINLLEGKFDIEAFQCYISKLF